MNRDSYYGNAIQQQQTGGRGDHWGLLAGESRRSNLPIIPNHTISNHTMGFKISFITVRLEETQRK